MQALAFKHRKSSRVCADIPPFQCFPVPNLEAPLSVVEPRARREGELWGRSRKQNGGKCRETVYFGPEKRQVVGIGQQKTLPLPKPGSPVHALIELVRRLRLDEGGRP